MINAEVERRNHELEHEVAGLRKLLRRHERTIQEQSETLIRRNVLMRENERVMRNVAGVCFLAGIVLCLVAGLILREVL